MTLLIRLFSVLVISTSLFVAGCSSGGSSAGFDKEDTDGDGIADIYDPDIDGDGIPNGSDSDIDGDGIPNDPAPVRSSGFPVRRGGRTIAASGLSSNSGSSPAKNQLG